MQCGRRLQPRLLGEGIGLVLCEEPYECSERIHGLTGDVV